MSNLKGNALEAVGRIDLWIMGLRVKVVYLIFCHSSGRSDWKEENMSQHFLIIVVLLMKENFVAVNFYSVLQGMI